MEKPFLIYLLIFFNIGIFRNFAQAEFQIKKEITSEELPICDNIGLESQMEVLKAAISEILKSHFGLLQFQLDKQKELWRNLDTKVDNIQLNLQTIEQKILYDNKDNLAEVRNMINQQNQLILPKLPAPAGDGKWELLLDIKEILKSQNKSLENLERKLSDTVNTEQTNIWKNVQHLDEKISKNYQVLQNIDKHVITIDQNIANVNGNIAVSINNTLAEYSKENVSDLESKRECFDGQEQHLVCASDFFPTSCANSKTEFCSNNSCRIYNHHYGTNTFLVSCDNDIEGGGWTVIQRRINGSVDFYRNWSEYKKGFGDINGEFFIGMDKLHALTTTLKPVELLIQLKDFNDTMVFAKYTEIEVGSEAELYKLKKVGKYSGDATNCFGPHEGFSFSTKDRNNDETTSINCPVSRKGAWWYHGCGWSNLNGVYSSNPFEKKRIYWCGMYGYDYSYKFVQMSIRPQR